MCIRDSPGVGMAVLMIMTYPVLYTYEAVQIIQFYLSAILVSQFMGSVVATYFAVPGEPSSIPAVIEGHKLAREGKATQAIFIAAGGSFVGGVIAFIFLYVLGLYLMDVFKMFTTGFNVIIISLVFVLIFVTPSKNIYERIGFPLSDSQIIRLVDSIKNPKWRFAIQLMATYGLRPEDLKYLHTRNNGKELWSDYRKSKGGKKGETTEPRQLFPLFVQDIDRSQIGI